MWSSLSTMSFGLIWTGPSQIEMIVNVPPLRVACSPACSVCVLPAASKESVLHLAAGELAHALGDVLLRRVDDGVGADLERLALAGLGDLGDDDPRRRPAGTAR